MLRITVAIMMLLMIPSPQYQTLAEVSMNGSRLKSQPEFLSNLGPRVCIGGEDFRDSFRTCHFHGAPGVSFSPYHPMVVRVEGPRPAVEGPFLGHRFSPCKGAGVMVLMLPCHG